MNIENYKVFIKIAQTRNLTVAARQLGYTQSGVSHIVAMLEDEFGFLLLNRRKSGVSLTQDGERILYYMKEVVNRDERLFQIAAEIKGLRAGRVRVGAFSSVAIKWFPSIIDQFNKKYENIELELDIGSYKFIEDKIATEEIDCGFTTKVTRKELDFIQLKQDPLLAVLPQNHPLASEKSIKLSDLAGVDFIIPGEGSNYDIGQILKMAEIQPRVKFAVNDDYAAIAMVRHGLGITIMPELMLDGNYDRIKVLELEPSCMRTIGIATRPNISLSPACRAFLEFVTDWVHNNCAQQ